MTVALPATAIKNKEHRSIAADALGMGWELTRTGGDHFQLRATGSGDTLHVVTVSGTPSRPSVDRIVRALKHCHDGSCTHGGRVSTGTQQVAARREAAKQREQGELERLFRAAATKTHSSPFGVKTKEPIKMKVKAKRAAKPSKQRVAATKWAKWYVADRRQAQLSKPMAQPQLEAVAKQAGHSWGLVRTELLDAGAVCDYRGRNGSWWSFPMPDPKDAPSIHSGGQEPVVDRGQATVYAAKAVPGGESLTGFAPPAGYDRQLGKLEGMLLVLDPTGRAMKQLNLVISLATGGGHGE